MASFEVSSDFYNIWNNINDLGLYDEDMQEDVLFGCADILVGAIKERFCSDYKTLETFSHVKQKGRVESGKDNVPYVTVTVDGKRDDGERYAAIAFVLNYGRKEEYGQIVGSHYWNRAIDETEKQMTKHLEECLVQRLREKGLI